VSRDNDTTQDEPLLRLLDLVAVNEGLSSARACKRLGLSRSELSRLLTALGPDPTIGGLDLLRVQHEGGRETLWLSDRARSVRTSA